MDVDDISKIILKSFASSMTRENGPSRNYSSKFSSRVTYFFIYIFKLETSPSHKHGDSTRLETIF